MASKKHGQRNGWLLPVTGKAVALCVLLFCSPCFAQDDLLTSVNLASKALDALSMANDLLSQDLSQVPTICPVPHKCVVSPFGHRRSPFCRNVLEFHPGIDLKAAYGTPVVACGGGVVTWAGSGMPYQGYGLCVVVTHSFNTDGPVVQTLYGHLSKILVEAGETVKRGQRIGLVGDTGRSTGCHLHLGVMVNGAWQDPCKWIF